MEKTKKISDKIAFIGGGMMAEAILKGMLAAKMVDGKNITVGEPNATRRTYLTKTYGIKATADNKVAVKDAKLVVLAIKPQMVDKVIVKTLVASIDVKATILSIMGSVDLAKLHKVLPKFSIVRAMPNTPLAIGSGMTALAPDITVTAAMLEKIKSIFGACGEVVVVDESAMEAITAISGCGPGYVFMLIDALADAGVNAGLPRDLAIKLAAQTFAGSGKMVIETGLHPAVLRDQVTSPGGTTIAGLHALEKGSVRAAMYNAVQAVLARSEKLKGK